MAKNKKHTGLSTFLSITMVLFVLGLFGILVINTNRVTNFFQENVMVILYFDKDLQDSEINGILKEVEQKDFVKKVKFLSKEDAALLFQDGIEKDFIEMIGDNPLPPSMEVYLTADAVRNNVDGVLSELRALNGIEDIDYQRDLMNSIEYYKMTIGYILMGMSGLLIIIAMILINGNIRLKVFANRFTIKSMQLVGATERFIIKPFIIQAAINTVIAGVVAFLLCLGFYYVVGSLFETYILENTIDIFNWENLTNELSIYSVLFVMMILLGLALVIPATFLSTKRYLKLKIDDLY